MLVDLDILMDMVIRRRDRDGKPKAAVLIGAVNGRIIVKIYAYCKISSSFFVSSNLNLVLVKLWS